MDFVDVRNSLDNSAVRRNTGARPHEHDVADTQFGERHGSSVRPLHAFSGVRQQRRERVECATGLGDGAHFQPMTEDHDRNQRRNFPPHVNLEDAECRRERSCKGDDDCQADERHHPGGAIRKFAHCAAEEDHAAISEYECSEHGGNETRAGEGRSRVAEPVLNVRRPKYDGNCESETQPEFVAKHRNGVPGVTIVGLVKV